MPVVLNSRGDRLVTHRRSVTIAGRWKIAATALLFAASTAANAADTERVAPVVDHHIHIQSAAVSEMMRKTMEKSPESFEGISPDILKVRTGSDALRELDRAGIRQAVLLSAGYMFASPMSAVDPGDIPRLMHAENQYNVDAARLSGGRLLAFVGINPLADNAVEELTSWSGGNGAAGVKLHLGNSQFDFDSAEHMERLAAFVRAASMAKLPLLIHSRSETGFTQANVRRFIEDVLSQAGDLPVQIAHGGGYGGLDQATLDSLATYRAAIVRGAPGTKNLVFDISAVVEYDLGESAADRNRFRREYVALMRQIGLKRFVLGSDWPGIHPPKEYFLREKAELPVTNREWQRLRRNKAPYMTSAWKRGSAAH